MTIAACFQPTYYPDLHYLHRMAKADVVVIMDDVQFTRNTAAHHQRTETPKGLLSVPIKRNGNGQRRPWKTTVCETNGWQSQHVESLVRWYPAAALNLGPLLDQIATFPVGYCEGIRQQYALLREYLPAMPRIVWQSELEVPGTEHGRELIFALCEAVSAKTYIVGRWAYEGYMGGASAFQRAKVTPLIQDLEFPPYLNQSRSRWNWSMLDVVVNLGQLGMREYLANVSEQGWFHG